MDSSCKSNSLESKKDNTICISSKLSSGNNSSSSKPSNNSSSNSSSSKLAMHKHDWVAKHSAVTVLEKGLNEQVQIVEMKDYSICNQCGADITGNP